MLSNNVLERESSLSFLDKAIRTYHRFIHFTFGPF